MNEPTRCWFKREADVNGQPIGEWEKGTIHAWAPHGIAGHSAIVSAAVDGKTLAIPLDRLAVTNDNPEEIKKRAEAAKKVALESSHRHALPPLRPAPTTLPPVAKPAAPVDQAAAIAAHNAALAEMAKTAK
jgi:hypothetical protein